MESLRNIIKTSGAVLGSTAGRGLLKNVENACEGDATLAAPATLRRLADEAHFEVATPTRKNDEPGHDDSTARES